MSQKIGAIDLGSGTIKFSAFEGGAGAWKALALEEHNTELRAGMGPERELKPGPVQATLKAVEAFILEARGLGLKKLPAYATSALRKAKNPEALLAPLKEKLGIEAKVLSEEDEGRLNLRGARERGLGPEAVVIDPGGDSTDCCWGKEWASAAIASLPFGSVSLLEQYGDGSDKTRPIAESTLRSLIEGVKKSLDAFSPALSLRRSQLSCAIRMNEPIARALALFAGQKKTRYALDDLRALTFAMAAMEHDSRAALIEGEPLGKVDRTPYGFASWIALLEWMDAGEFLVEPFGIKLGAALALNGIS